MASFLSAAIAAVSGSSIGSALVRIIVAYGVSRLINGNTNAPSNAPEVDQGVRIQLQPNTTNPIPLLYGSAYFGGNITDVRLTDDNKNMWVCLTLSEKTSTTTTLSGKGVTTTFEEIYWNNQLVKFKSDAITVDYLINQDGTVDRSVSGLIKIYCFEGGSQYPTQPYGTTPVTYTYDARDLFPGWSETDTMTKLSFAIVKITYNRDQSVTGLADMKFKLTNNIYLPGDAMYDYMRNTISGLALTDDEIDIVSLQALNDYSDDEINFYDETTGSVLTLGDRYQMNGLIDPQKPVLSNLQEMANSCGSFVNYDIATGKWGVVINRDQSPVLYFDDSNIISGIDLTGTNLDNQYNSVEVEFPHRFIKDQIDTIRVELPEEFKNANEPDNTLRIRLSMLNEPVQARELAYLELYQNRMDRVITFTTDYSKINAEAGDVITVTNDVYNFVEQPFRIIRVREIESEEGSLAVEITAQEYDATLYTAGGQPRRPRLPTTSLDLPSLGVIAKPNPPSVSSVNNNAQPTIYLTATVPSGVVDRVEFWEGDHILTTVKNANGSPYTTGNVVVARIINLDPGVYSFRVRAGNDNAYSSFSDNTSELTWSPVQVTNEVNQNTTVSSGGLEDLLPTLGMGALAYLAYKTLYPDLVKALSQTDLGKLLGIVDPDEIAAAQELLELQSNAFRTVVVNNVQLAATEDQSLTFIPGEGITLVADDIGHEITISADGATSVAYDKIIAGGEVLNAADHENTISIEPGTNVNFDINHSAGVITINAEIDGGNPYDDPDIDAAISYRVLDNCLVTETLPAKKTFKVGVAEQQVIITQGDFWYDACYRQTVPTCRVVDFISSVITDRHRASGYINTYRTVPATFTIVPEWKRASMAGRTLLIRSVSETNYIMLRDWIYDIDTDTVSDVPLQSPGCDVGATIWDRPLFPTTDYPAGYTHATYNDLTEVLNFVDAGLLLQIIPARPGYTITYPGQTNVIRHARICFNNLGTEPQLDFNEI